MFAPTFNVNIFAMQNIRLIVAQAIIKMVIKLITPPPMFVVVSDSATFVQIVSLVDYYSSWPYNTPPRRFNSETTPAFILMTLLPETVYTFSQQQSNRPRTSIVFGIAIKVNVMRPPGHPYRPTSFQSEAIFVRLDNRLVFLSI